MLPQECLLHRTTQNCNP